MFNVFVRPVCCDNAAIHVDRSRIEAGAGQHEPRTRSAAVENHTIQQSSISVSYPQITILRCVQRCRPFGGGGGAAPWSDNDSIWCKHGDWPPGPKFVSALQFPKTLLKLGLPVSDRSALHEGHAEPQVWDMGSNRWMSSNNLQGGRK